MLHGQVTRFRIVPETVSCLCEAASKGSATLGCETIHFNKLQALLCRCLGVWGPMEDLCQFLLDNFQLRLSGHMLQCVSRHCHLYRPGTVQLHGKCPADSGWVSGRQSQ